MEVCGEYAGKVIGDKQTTANLRYKHGFATDYRTGGCTGSEKQACRFRNVNHRHICKG